MPPRQDVGAEFATNRLEDLEDSISIDSTELGNSKETRACARHEHCDGSEPVTVPHHDGKDEQRYNNNTAESNRPGLMTPGKAGDEPVTWLSLPNKGQLAILTLARLSEPLSERSLAAYMFFQLKWFDPSLPDSTITSQGGLLTAAFAGAQFFTAVWWGRAADHPRIGRKAVLLVGLTGTAIASIGVGFSSSFIQAVFFRALAGALNGNIGVMRTMLSEIIVEKKYQSRAFLLLPMCFNLGVVVGPIIGGFLADPIHGLPRVFGPGSTLGGVDGVAWMRAFPYGLPNLFSGCFILASVLGVIFGLDETHEALKDRPDRGRQFGRRLADFVRGCRKRKGYDHKYSRLDTEDVELTPIMCTSNDLTVDIASARSRALTVSAPHQLSPSSGNESKSPLRSILSKNVVLTLVSHHLLALHVSAFNALIFLLLPAPRHPNSTWHIPSLSFTGGLGLSQSQVGLAMAILGVIGLPLQILFYPPIHTKMGTLRGYRSFLPFSILAYTVLPLLVLLPERQPAWVVWLLLAAVLASQVLSRTFALTGTVILVNNSSPGSKSLGTIHGMAQSASSAARMLGPTVGGYLLGLGLVNNFVGGVWWLMATVCALQWGLLFMIYEGDGKGGKV